jgi:iron complex outermembrane receptor protein
MVNFKRGSRPVWAVVSLIVAAAAAQSGRAQAQADDALGLEEVVVTARKTSEQLLDVPLAITAFTAEAIESRGITNLDDVAAFTPGLTFSNVIGDFLPAPVIRGVAPIDIFGELNTAIFFDGVYVSGREGINFNQLDLERIEVVKGPQAALYGRNAFSGAINYVSAKPGDTAKSKATVTMGNRGKRLVSLTMSGPIDDNGLKGRATFLKDEWDGSYRNQYAGSGKRETIGGYEFTTFNGTLFWESGGGFNAELGTYISSDNVDNSPTTAVEANCEDRRVRDQKLGVAAPRSSRLLNYCGELPSVGENSLSAVPGASGEKRHITRSHIKLSWPVGGGTLDAITGYSKVSQGFLVDGSRNSGETAIFTYQPTPIRNVPGLGATSGPRKTFTTGLLQIGGVDKTSEYSQEIRFASDLEQAMRYSFGLYYYENTSSGGVDGVIATKPLPTDFFSFCLACTALGPTTFVDFAPGAGNAAFLPWFNDPVGGAQFGKLIIDEASAPSVFAALEYDLNDQLTASIDGRYTDEQRSFLDKRTGSNGKDNWELLSWRTTLRYKPAENLTYFAGIAHSEKAGDFDPTTVRLVSRPTVDVTLPGAFDSEGLMSYELGLKAELMNRRVGVELDLYYLDWSDIVIPQVVSSINGQDIVTPTGVNVNGGDATVKGVELSIVARVARGLDFNIGASYADPKYDRAKVDSFIDFPTYAPTGDVSGNQILRTSKVQANAGLQFSSDVGADREFFLRGDVAHRGKQFADASNQTIVPASTNVNASLGLRGQSFSLELWGRNLTDEDAPTGAFRDVYFSNSLPNGVNTGGTFFPFRYSVSHPRRTTYGVTVRYNF